MFLVRTFITFLILLSATSSLAQETPSIPDPLKPWVPWVMERDKTRECALVGYEKRCIWYGPLQLELNSDKGSFQLSVQLDAPGVVQIPGDDRTWPSDVKVNGKGGDQRAVVLNRNSRAEIELGKGSYKISGSFSWREIPASIVVAPATLNVLMTINGKNVNGMKREGDGRVWTGEKRTMQEGEQDTLSFSVARRLQDGIPFHVDTVITLRVTGQARKIKLAGLILPGALLTGYNSPLRVAPLKNGETEIELLPGVHTVVVNTLYTTPPRSLQVPEGLSSEWPTEEYWSWIPKEELRTVELKGGLDVDPNQVELPTEWQNSTTIAMKKGTTLTLDEIKREAFQEEHPSFTLTRDAWLSSDGTTFDIRDSLYGFPHGAKRIDVGAAIELKRVLVDGIPMMISRDPLNNALGVEVRSQKVAVTAEATVKIEEELPAAGWEIPISKSEWNVHLPPGWSLLYVSGADWIRGIWWERWTTGTVMSAVIALLGILYLYSWRGALLSLPFLIGVEYAAFPLLVSTALGVIARFAPSSEKVKHTLALLAVVTLLFGLSHQIAASLAPNYSPPLLDDPFDVLFSYMNGAFGALVLLLSFVLALVAVFLRYFKTAAICASILVVTFLGRAMVGSYFNDSSLSAGSSDDFMTSTASKEELFSDNLAPAAQGRRAPKVEGRKMALAESAPPPVRFDTADPLALPQVGEGLPSWKTTATSFGWEGDSKDTKPSLTLISPNFTRASGVLQLLALILLSLLVVRGPRQVVLLLLLVTATLTSTAKAEDLFPSPALLKELEERITFKLCREKCVGNPQMSLSVDGSIVTLRGEIHSGGAGAYPLPSSSSGINFNSITLDGSEITSTRDPQGLFWLRIPQGVHELHAVGDLLDANYTVLQFSLPPQNFRFASPDWSIAGFDDDGKVQGLLHLSKNKDQRSEAKENEQEPMPWYRISRSLSLGAKWKVSTSVTRNGAINKPTVVTFPLIKGEVVNDTATSVRDGVATVNFIEGATSRSWESEIPREGPIALASRESDQLVEEWRLYCSPTWRCRTSSTLHTANPGSPFTEELFYPIPGEELVIEVARASGVEGPSKAITHARMEVERSTRESVVTLNLTVRTNKRDAEDITLPEGATLTSVTRSGHNLTLQPEGRVLHLPLDDGEHLYRLQWKMPRKQGPIERLPQVTLQSPAKNIEVVTNQVGRWTLWLEQRGWSPFLSWWADLAIALGATLVAVLIERRRSSILWFLPIAGALFMDSYFIFLLAVGLLGVTYLKSSRVRDVAAAITAFILFVILVDAFTSTLPSIFASGERYSWQILERGNEIPSIMILSLPPWSWKIVLFSWALLAALFLKLRYREKAGENAL